MIMQEPLFDVISPGIHTTVQDMGRFGYQHVGISTSGAMDIKSAAWANRLLDNAIQTPLLEIMLGGLTLQARVPLWIALTGAELSAEVDGTPIEGWTRIALRPGQQLSIGYARAGQWGYLAVNGGFALSSVLGSHSTQQREGLGGIDGHGSALARHDVLHGYRERPALTLKAQTPRAFRDDLENPCASLRLMQGPDYHRFTSDDALRLLSTPWHVSALSNRMGYRLEGAQLSGPPTRQWSIGVLPGAIQIVPEGTPIVLMSDCQTMGGYPVFGWLHPLDRGRLAQRRAHQQIRFTLSTLDEVQQSLKHAAAFFGNTPLR